MHLRNFHQISIEEVRQVMTRLPVKVPLSTETAKGVGWRLETIGVTHPLWKISGYATGIIDDTLLQTRPLGNQASPLELNK